MQSMHTPPPYNKFAINRFLDAAAAFYLTKKIVIGVRNLTR